MGSNPFCPNWMCCHTMCCVPLHCGIAVIPTKSKMLQCPTSGSLLRSLPCDKASTASEILLCTSNFFHWCYRKLSCSLQCGTTESSTSCSLSEEPMSKCLMAHSISSNTREGWPALAGPAPPIYRACPLQTSGIWWCCLFHYLSPLIINSDSRQGPSLLFL